MLRLLVVTATVMVHAVCVSTEGVHLDSYVDDHSKAGKLGDYLMQSEEGDTATDTHLATSNTRRSPPESTAGKLLSAMFAAAASTGGDGSPAAAASDSPQELEQYVSKHGADISRYLTSMDRDGRLSKYLADNGQNDLAWYLDKLRTKPNAAELVRRRRELQDSVGREELDKYVSDHEDEITSYLRDMNRDGRLSAYLTRRGHGKMARFLDTITNAEERRRRSVATKGSRKARKHRHRPDRSELVDEEIARLVSKPGELEAFVAENEHELARYLNEMNAEGEVSDYLIRHGHPKLAKYVEEMSEHSHSH